MARRADESNRFVGAALALAFLLAAVAALYLGEEGTPVITSETADMGAVTALTPRLLSGDSRYEVVAEDWSHSSAGPAVVLHVVTRRAQDPEAVAAIVADAVRQTRGRYSQLVGVKVEAFRSLSEFKQGAEPVASRAWAAGRPGGVEYDSVGGDGRTAVPVRDNAP